MIYDTIIIGGGPAGLSAATKAKEHGLRVLLLDENEFLGGILPQCIHPGFGVIHYRKEYTGPEFAHILITKLNSAEVEYITEAHVLRIDNYSDMEKRVIFASPQGVKEIWTRTIIYAAGARERHQFEVGIVGDRVSGIFTAGEAQSLMDLYGVMPGKEIVIAGSGDVGLIMARRFALEGAKVKLVVELQPYAGGLARNIVQCLNDFKIPLCLSHRVAEVKGNKRVERVKIVQVDEHGQDIPNSEFWVKSDTLLISAGLVPKVKMLSKIGVRIDSLTGGPVVNDMLETTVPGIFVAGNSLMINDMVDYVVEQGALAADGVNAFLKKGGFESRMWHQIVPGKNVRFVVPHLLSSDRTVNIYARVNMPLENVDIEIPEIGKKVHKIAMKPSEMFRIRLRSEEIQKSEKFILEVKK